MVKWRLGVLLALAVACGFAAAQQSPSSRPALAQATALVDQGRFRDAEKAVEAIVTAEPKNALAWNLMGRIRAAEKKWEPAASHFEKARDLAPGDAVIRQNLGICRYEHARTDDARRELAEAIRLDPKLPMPHLYSGKLAQDAGDVAAAEAAYSRAAELAPADPWPLYFRGSLFHR